MKDDKKIIPEDLETVVIDTPLPGASVLLATTDGGRTTVDVTVNPPTGTTTIQVWTWIYKKGTTLPSSRPDYAIPLDRLGTANQFQGQAPVAASSLASPAANNNTVVAWAVFTTPSGDVNGLKSQDFKAQCPSQIIVAAQATNCIWFAWAPMTYTAPTFGESGESYHPRGLIVPSDAHNVTISAAAADRWRHDPNPSYESDANGQLDFPGDPQRIDPEAAYSTDYQNATCHSLGIQGLKTYLNKLVGLWGNSFQPPPNNNPISQFNIGLGPVTAAVNATTNSALFLACHDTHQWSNNSGTVHVTVTWS